MDQWAYEYKQGEYIHVMNCKNHVSVKLNQTFKTMQQLVFSKTQEAEIRPK